MSKTLLLLISVVVFIAFSNCIYSKTINPMSGMKTTAIDTMPGTDTTIKLLFEKNYASTRTRDSSNFIQQRIKDSLSKVIDSLEQKKNSLSAAQSQLKRKLDEQLYSFKNQKKIADSTLTANNDSIIATKRRLDSIISLAEKKKADADSLIKVAKKATDTVNINKNKADSVGKIIQDRMAIIQNQMAVIAKQHDSLEVVATITMRDSVKIYNGTSDSANIKQISIWISEGLIMEIVVFTDKGIFRNKSSIINLSDFFGNIDDILFREDQKYSPNKNDRTFVLLQDVIEYTPMNSYRDIPYMDFRVVLTRELGKNTYLVRESTSINTYFNIAAFTDIKGLSGDANGIAQFVADAKFITRTRNYKNTATIWGNYISFRGGLSKFDNSVKGSVLMKNDSINRKELLQRAYYTVGVKYNLFHFFGSPLPKHLISDMQVNVGYNFLGSKVLDTMYKDAARTVLDTTIRTVTQNQFYLEPTINFSRHRNFSMTLSMPFYFNSIKNSAGISNSGFETWICPGISLMYFGKREGNNKIFFRYNHFINLNNNTQAFTQMQLGYSANLTDVWSNNK